VDPSVTAAFSLAGRGALVTGSESGLGRAIAAAFVEAGATVVGADIGVPADESGSRSPAGHVRVRLDLCDRDDVATGVDRAIDAVGGIDVCVNCAGIGGRSPALDYPDDLWDRVLATNLTGSFTVAKLIGAHMIARGGGSIVNIASVGGLVGYAGSAGYQASKGAIVQLTRTLAVEWGPSNVRVNAIAPGHIATELVQRQWEVEPELREFFLSRTPLGRLGDPVDVANAALFLASDAARMITGQVLAVDGGYTSH
jgi:NAD(P)-dependent dehydrogenase (short-subunit alcohol dehydrogenase family)